MLCAKIVFIVVFVLLLLYFPLWPSFLASPTTLARSASVSKMRTTTFLSTALSLGASGVAATAVDVAPRAAAPCDDVHMFLARGNNEPYPGRQGKMVELICQDLSGSCGYEDLVYSALYTDLYCQTVYDGVVAGFTQLSAYANRCPSSKLILLGYSQGAQIVTDILAGGGATLYNGCVQPDTPALDRSTAPGNMGKFVVWDIVEISQLTRLTQFMPP